MAWIIEKVGRPALVIAHNKTLAAQLCNEFREFFPDNAVEYFVSYYDYYQPEAYVPQADLYIEKDSSRNDDISRLRLAATSALFTRRDVVVVASGLVHLRPRLAGGVARPRARARGRGDDRPRRRAADADREPVRAQRHRARARPLPGEGRRHRGAAGELRDGVPHLVLRRRGRVDLALRPADRRGLRAARQPRDLAGDRVRDLDADGRARGRRHPPRARGAGAAVRGAGQAARGAPAAPAHRVRPRDDARSSASATGSRTTRGTSRAGRRARTRSRCSTTSPTTSSCFVDESHQTVPQLGGMYEGDRSRKQTLVDFGFRLPSALDNRPLRFDEFLQQGAAARLRLGDAGPVRAPPLEGGRRAADPADLRRRPRGRAARDQEPDRRPAQRDPAPRGGRASACWSRR